MKLGRLNTRPRGGTTHVDRLTCRPKLVATALLALISVLVLAPAALSAEDHEHATSGAAPSTDGRIGVLVADHGEPPEYNAWTYESFREFFQHLIRMGLLPQWLAAMDTGTILYDADCPACTEASEAPRLMDAWLRPHDGPAVFVPPSDSLPGHYVIPDGPGLREPDIYELVGLGAWHEWQRMGGRSPNYDEKLSRKRVVIDRLRETYGDRLAIRVGYMIDPRFGGGRQGVREALDALVHRDRIDSLVVAYHGVGFSDIMQTHHLRHMVAAHLSALGVDVPVRYTAPPGTTDHYVAAIVDKVRAELAKVPARAPVALHLSGHGLPTTMCGDYDCGADAYHRSSADLFARVRPAVVDAIDRPGRTAVFHLYGDGAEGEDDPDDKVDSPIEALDKRAADGFTHVIDIPYEFDANSRDTLIVLRQGYQRTPPDWNDRWESEFGYRGMRVTLANASGGDAHKADALYAVIVDALGVGSAATASRAAAASSEHGGSVHAAGVRRSASDHVVGDDHDPHESADDHGRMSESTSGGADEDHEHGGTLAAASRAHGHREGGANAGVGWMLAVAGGIVLAAAALSRVWRTPVRVAVAAVGVQLVGLGWDVIAHAWAGEPVHLFENAGHWFVLVGLLASAGAAAVFTRDAAAYAD